MNVLALNAGSNTLRYKLVTVGPDGPALADGMVDHVKGPKVVEAAERALRETADKGVDAVAVRIVHGGERTDPVVVTPAVRPTLDAAVPLAPLHMPTGLALVDAAITAAGGRPVVAVFDTSFHRTLPAVAHTYAIPPELKLRRYGFHGFAHHYASAELPRLVGRTLSKIVSLHLGGGTSACAVVDGRSVDTSMGLTPLAGTVMSTRCGDVDPGLVIKLFRDGRSADEVEQLLYKQSGLLGLSGRSDDIRDLEPLAAAGDARATLALDVFAYRIRQYVGAYAAAMNGLDGLVLSGALAEHSPTLRARVLSGLVFLGVHLDAGRNAAAGPETPGRLDADGSPVAVWMVPADEERQMARDATAVL